LGSCLAKSVKAKKLEHRVRVIYWAVLLIPLILGLVDNRNKVKEREQGAKRAQGIDFTRQGREHLHVGLEARSIARIELGIEPLRKAIVILQEFPAEYSREIQARHDLALTFERLSYGTSKHGCTYQIKDHLITAKYETEGTSLSPNPVLEELRCTDFTFADAEMWYKAEEQYNALYDRLVKRPGAAREDGESELPAAARSTGYFYICDNLRVGGSALNKAQDAFKMVADITSPSKGNLPARHEDAKAKLEVLAVLDKAPEVDKAHWESDCMPRGTAVALPQKVQDTMVNSSWHKNLSCPDFNTLMLLRIPYWGFEGKTHQGEMVVAKSVAGDVLKVFRQLYAERFPIEQMARIEHYGGDDNASMAANNTSAFNCRLLTDSNSLSEHAYGTAIDINPKQNPYVKGTTVLPPEGKDYLDRSTVRPGMVEQDSVKAVFESIGWKWGGDWESLKDYQHFSQSGR
jgi:D-alanyl-D-alanine carboxypeptidase-like protein